MTTKATPRTAAEMNARMEEIGKELASRGGFPVPNARALEAEWDQLRIDYARQLDAESAKPSAETLRKIREQDERTARTTAALAEAAR